MSPRSCPDCGARLEAWQTSCSECGTHVAVRSDSEAMQDAAARRARIAAEREERRQRLGLGPAEPSSKLEDLAARVAQIRRAVTEAGRAAQAAQSGEAALDAAAPTAAPAAAALSGRGSATGTAGTASPAGSAARAPSGWRAPTGARRIHVDQVRFVGEDRFSQLAWESQRPPAALLHADDTDLEAFKRNLLIRGIELTRDMALEVHLMAEHAMALFDIHRPLQVFQVRGEAENAMMITVTSREVVMVFQESLLDRFSGGALMAVIGHELGHFLAHGPRTPFPLPEECDPDLALRHSMSRELTSDRFGLLACENLGNALMCEMLLATGLSVQALDWQPEAYLASCDALMDRNMEAILARQPGTVVNTHPEHHLRGHALGLFWRSDLFHALTGKGPGDLRIADVDERLYLLLCG